jgi:hypothetical protein
MKSNLIILATYWNEIKFVKPSLEQIEKINPIEVIICDGNFDPRVPNYSIDGTREIIKDFVNLHNNAKMIDARRPVTLKDIIDILNLNYNRPITKEIIRIGFWKTIIQFAISVAYRRNQALTFSYMKSISTRWAPGRWFMTYDCDQFYSDEMIKKIAIISNDREDNVDLLLGDELTFFYSFGEYTNDYEKRKYNNMPHRIYSDTIFRPTRSIIRENQSAFGFKNLWSKDLYINLKNIKTKNIGIYFHYKIKNKERYNAGYLLGSRKKPDTSKYCFKKYRGNHPIIIRKYLKIKKWFNCE